MSKQVHEIPVVGGAGDFPQRGVGSAATDATTSSSNAAPPAAAPPQAAPSQAAQSHVAPPTSAPPAYESMPPPTVTPAAPVAAPSTPGQDAAAPMAPPVAEPLPPMPPPQIVPAVSVPASAAPEPSVQDASSASTPSASTPSDSTPAAPLDPSSFPPPSASAPVSEQWSAPSADDTLASDLDPQGRTGTGITPHSGVDPELLAALQDVVRLSASDLHVTTNAPPMLRIDGSLTPLPGAPVWDRERVTTALFSLLTESQRERFEKELELDFGFAISENARFRVNYYRQRDVVGGAFRIIPTEIKPLEALGIPDTVARFATLSRGLVLVTGPTGSGKSTTLAALVDLVNRTRTDHIVTVEDPIEFMHGNKRSLINQREVGNDTHSFNQALKHVLRQDPDVILIGELRDLETISVALTAAETGHLVFATLHTQDAAQTVDRIIDVFPPNQQDQVRVQLASTLQGVVCQTLVKLASGKGRIVATEVMVATAAIANLIREGKTYQIPTALQGGRELGMFTMDQHLAELVDKGKITHAAAIEKAHDLEGLKRLIHRADPGGGGVASQMAAAAADFGDGFSARRQR